MPTPTPPPPNLIDVLLSIKGVLIPIGLIGIAKLVFFVAQWNYKELGKFIKEKPKEKKAELDSFTKSILYAQKKKYERKKREYERLVRKTDGANFLAIITQPVSSIFSFFKGFFGKKG